MGRAIRAILPSLKPARSIPVSAKNWPTVSKQVRQAGSWSTRMWLRLSSATKWAPGMPEATARPTSSGMRRSSFECSTIVGAFIFAFLAVVPA